MPIWSIIILTFCILLATFLTTKIIDWLSLKLKFEDNPKIQIAIGFPILIFLCFIPILGMKIMIDKIDPNRKVKINQENLEKNQVFQLEKKLSELKADLRTLERMSFKYETNQTIDSTDKNVLPLVTKMIEKTTKSKELLLEKIKVLNENNIENRQKIIILDSLKREEDLLLNKIEETYQPSSFSSYLISLGGLIISFIIGVLSSLTATYYLKWRTKDKA